ncbi:hypothetical protein [Stenotrophomonas sp. SAU14A_NAIMI4_5]|uniref:hypothetical protein n=1 Tax=Stenotrophomonas sp. SAU14A_NAIMI4_5 TaxID=2072413 RepID=UPI00131F1E02|nr:hypothetical protein [Stenotrophomonas sp. SAU14A_NAIMI4_5]
MVAILAWRTARRATEIAQTATEIARHQRQEDRDAHARILGRLLLSEVTALPARLAALGKVPAVAVEISGDAIRIRSAAALEHLLEEGQFSVLPSAERVEARIHELPDRLGDDLATLISHSRSLNDVVRRMRSRLVTTERPNVSPPVLVGYRGRAQDFELLEDEIQFFKTLAIEYANDFREFVGVPKEDYSRFA